MIATVSFSFSKFDFFIPQTLNANASKAQSDNFWIDESCASGAAGQSIGAIDDILETGVAFRDFLTSSIDAVVAAAFAVRFAFFVVFERSAVAIVDIVCCGVESADLIAHTADQRVVEGAALLAGGAWSATDIHDCTWAWGANGHRCWIQVALFA